MRNVAEFTQAENGLRIGVPTLGALMLLNVEGQPMGEGAPASAKTLIRYMLPGENGARFAWVRDPYKHVQALLPQSVVGPWLVGLDPAGAQVAFPQNSIGGYVQQAEDLFHVTLCIPTGPVGVDLKTSYDDLLKLTGDGEEQANAGDASQDSPRAERRGSAVPGRRADKGRPPKRKR